MEEEYQESLKVKNATKYIDSDETDDRIPLTKDLTAIVEKISLKKNVKNNLNEEQEIFLQKIPKTSVAVFQNVHFDKDTQCDIRSEVSKQSFNFNFLTLHYLLLNIDMFNQVMQMVMII